MEGGGGGGLPLGGMKAQVKH